MVHVYISQWVCPRVQEGQWLTGSAEGREEVVTHQLTARTAHVHSTGGDKVLHVQICTHAHTHAHLLTQTAYSTLSSQCPHVHTQTHTSISTHDKAMQVTFTHSRSSNARRRIQCGTSCSQQSREGNPSMTRSESFCHSQHDSEASASPS